MQNIHGIQRPLLPPQIGKVARGRERPMQPVERRSFGEILKQQLTKQTEIKFSAHAMNRLQTRKMDLTQKDLERLDEAIAKADQKGARESLVLFDDRAFVVSVTNRTVITAIDGDSLKEGIFTNIDSAVII